MAINVINCGKCGENFDPSVLSEVFKHEHKGLSLDDVMGVRGTEKVPLYTSETVSDFLNLKDKIIQKLESDNKALLEACEAFDEADASDDGTGEAIGRVVSAKVLIKKAIEQAKEGGVMWATGF